MIMDCYPNISYSICTGFRKSMLNFKPPLFDFQSKVDLSLSFFLVALSPFGSFGS